MRISDWSSDVCSSDLGQFQCVQSAAAKQRAEGVRLRLHGQWLASMRTVGYNGGNIHLGTCSGICIGHFSERFPRALSCRSETDTSELQPLMRRSYFVFCLNKKN